MQGYLVDKIIQMIPSALEDFREVWGAVVRVRNVRFIGTGKPFDRRSYRWSTKPL